MDTTPSSPTPSTDEKQLAMWAHLLGFSGYLVPFGNIIGPFVVWQLKKDQSPYVVEHAKEALNFQLTMFGLSLIALALTCIIIGIPLLVGLIIFEVVVMILAAMRANDGQHYRYPMTIRFFG